MVLRTPHLLHSRDRRSSPSRSISPPRSPRRERQPTARTTDGHRHASRSPPRYGREKATCRPHEIDSDPQGENGGAQGRIPVPVLVRGLIRGLQPERVLLTASIRTAILDRARQGQGTLLTSGARDRLRGQEARLFHSRDRQRRSPHHR